MFSPTSWLLVTKLFATRDLGFFGNKPSGVPGGHSVGFLTHYLLEE